jgi:hypothetical protein
VRSSTVWTRWNLLLLGRISTGAAAARAMDWTGVDAHVTLYRLLHAEIWLALVCCAIAWRS